MALTPQKSTRSSPVKPLPAPNPLSPATSVGAPVEQEPDRSFVVEPSVAATSPRKRVSRISAWAVGIGIVTTIAGLVWLEQRIRRLEKQQTESATEIAGMRAPQPTPNPTNSPPAEPGSEDSNSKTIANGEQQTPRVTGDLPANPKLPMSKSADKSKTKKARTGSDKPGNANRSQGNAGVRAGNTGAARRSATPNPTPRPSPLPPSRPLSTPSARPQ